MRAHAFSEDRGAVSDIPSSRESLHRGALRIPAVTNVDREDLFDLPRFLIEHVIAALDGAEPDLEESDLTASLTQPMLASLE